MTLPFWVTVIGLALLAACGSESSSEADVAVPTATPESTPTAAEQAYLNELSGVDDLIDEKFTHFGELLDRLYPTRGALFTTLEEAGAGTAFDAGLAAMEALEPPERYQEEHALALEELREFRRVDRQVGQAVLDHDLVAFALANVELTRLSTESPLRHSATFCVARFQGSPHLCERPDLSSAGTYGGELYAMMSRIETDVRPSFSGQLPAMNDEERLEVTTTLVPGAVAALEEIAESLGALNPPESLQADHDTIVRYIDDVVALVTELRVEAERGEVSPTDTTEETLTRLYCSTGDGLSPAIVPFANVHFGVPDICD